jgi:hypothetical protein
MIATTPIVIVVVLLLALVSLVVVPGAALIAIPLVIVLGLAAVVLGVRAASASRGGTRVEHQEPGAAVGDALSPPETREREIRERNTAISREQTQG